MDTLLQIHAHIQLNNDDNTFKVRINKNLLQHKSVTILKYLETNVFFRENWGMILDWYLRSLLLCAWIIDSMLLVQQQELFNTNYSESGHGYKIGDEYIFGPVDNHEWYAQHDTIHPAGTSIIRPYGGITSTSAPS